MTQRPTLRDCGFWRGEAVILASKSQGRARVLTQAGIPFEVEDSCFDERSLPDMDNIDARRQASILAREKAQIVSDRRKDRIVVGADQTLGFKNRTLHKSPDIKHAIAQLRMLSGTSHQLHSAVACMRDGDMLFEFVVSARIEMRNLSENALRAYAETMGETILTTVGGYEIEGLGASLVAQIHGDIFTIIGLPVFELLSGLREIGVIDEEGER
ncbi:MAG: Maf family protein [Rhodoblastus sp.]